MDDQFAEFKKLSILYLSNHNHNYKNLKFNLELKTKF